MNSKSTSVFNFQKTLSILGKSACLILAVTLTSCFEHETPFTATGNKNPEPQLIGVWKDRSNPYYYQFEKIDESTLKVTSSEFDLEHPDYRPIIREQRVITYTMDADSLLIAQLTKSNQEKDSLKMWGYFPYVIAPDGNSMKIFYLEVSKNGDIGAVRKALADRKDPVAARNLEKLDLPSIPASIPADHLQSYNLEAQRKEIEALKNKVAALEKNPPSPPAVQKPALLIAQPVPVFTNDKAVEDTWIVDGEFDYGVKVSFDVTNTGEAGLVEVAVTLTSSEGNWTRKEKSYFEKGETKNLFGVFTEPTVESKNIQYRINCTK